MQIRTSNYRNIDMITNRNYVAVSIDKQPSADFKGLCIPELAPESFLLQGVEKGTISVDLFRVLYQKQLDQLSVTEIISKIIKGTGNQKRICLVSGTETQNYCHRKILSEWLAKYGYYSHELYSKK